MFASDTQEKRETASESIQWFFFLSPIISFSTLFQVFKAEQQRHLKHPQFCELHKVPQRDPDGVY